MSEDTKNENNEEVEETSEEVETEEETEESTDSAEQVDENSEAEADGSDDDASEDDGDEEDSEDASDEEASDEDSDEDSSDDEADEADAESDDSEDEAADEESADEDDAESDDSDEEASEEEASDEDDADDSDEVADDADDEDDSDESDDAADVEADSDDLAVADGEEDPHVGLVRGDHVEGVAAYFDHPDHLLYAAAQVRDSDYEAFDAFSPFPIHGMDDALGVGRSWIPWVTFGAGSAGLMTAIGLQFGIMGFDWPMNFGGKPFIAWPSFVPIMFELTVLFAGVITGLTMLKAAGCFQKPFIIDTEITNDRFVLWISAQDDNFDREGVIEFMKELNPSEIRTIKKDA